MLTIVLALILSLNATLLTSHSTQSCPVATIATAKAGIVEPVRGIVTGYIPQITLQLDEQLDLDSLEINAVTQPLHRPIPIEFKLNRKGNKTSLAIGARVVIPIGLDTVIMILDKKDNCTMTVLIKHPRINISTKHYTNIHRYIARNGNRSLPKIYDPLGILSGKVTVQLPQGSREENTHQTLLTRNQNQPGASREAFLVFGSVLLITALIIFLLARSSSPQGSPQLSSEA